MAGHAQLKFVMTECSKTQIRLTGLILCCFFCPLCSFVLLFCIVIASEEEIKSIYNSAKKKLALPKANKLFLNIFHKLLFPYFAASL